MLNKIMPIATSIFLASCLCNPPKTSTNANDAHSASTKTVNLAIWSNYITPEMIAEFNEKTGIRIEVTNYSSNEELLAKLQAGATGYDVVVPSDYMVAAMVSLGLAQKLDKSMITNMSELDPKLMRKNFDPTNDHSVPYGYTISGLAFNKEKYKGSTQSWSAIFENKEASGRISMLDDVRETMGAALKFKGFSLNSVKPEELAIGKALLIAAKPHVKAFTSEPSEPVIQGEVWAAQMYSSDALQARRKTNGKIMFSTPIEGATMAIDNLVIPVGAEHMAEAHALINYLISKEANLKFVQSIMAGPVNINTRASLPEDLQNEPALFPPDDIIARCEMMQDLGEATDLYDRIWTEVKVATAR